MLQLMFQFGQAFEYNLAFLALGSIFVITSQDGTVHVVNGSRLKLSVCHSNQEERMTNHNDWPTVLC